MQTNQSELTILENSKLLKPTRNTYGYLKIGLSLDADWDNLDTVLVFSSRSSEAVRVPFELGVDTLVPQQVLTAETFSLCLVGYQGTSVKVITNLVTVPLYESGQDSEVSPTDPDPDVYVKILQDIAGKADNILYENGTLYLRAGEQILSESPISGGGGTSTLVWLPSIDEFGVITFTQSNNTTPPEPRDITGPDGVSPIITGVSKNGKITTIVITDANEEHLIHITDGLDGSNGLDGDDGRGIASISKTSTADLVDTYTITYTDATTTQFNVTNGRNGTNGLNGISPTVSKEKVGKVTTVTIIDAVGTTTLTVNDGVDGTNGVGITGVAKTGTVGLIDTYTIAYSDAHTSTFTITNGAQGPKGDPGQDFEFTGTTIPDAPTVSITLNPNTNYKTATLTTCTSLTILLAAGNWFDEYVLYFTTGAAAPTITLPVGITWVGGTPTFSANKTYIISIQNGIGVVANV